MSLFERIEQASGSIAVSGVLAVSSGGWWLVRRIFTNQKQIELMQQSLEARDKQRDEDREAMTELRQDVRDMRGDIQQILRK
ncbi:hypothetical protein [Phaeobacter inhibens]|uniref:hypothetical protein n=1 Tax=Phaeobacter inhibens TaxID=221822 RepID=UPI0001632C80|nr:hypothetical protein [Phaeobacter inhibens]AFO91544.1 hypothetical protein PGA1_c18470 [Phaeobacter inhibens DSM 17395]AUQ46211.1 hypothetical protein PhaeoP10_01873 [Phaeobacter inhibens]